MRVETSKTSTLFFATGSPDNPLRLRDGGVLPGARIAYETWGSLNAEHSNAIFLFHALSGSHHAAGYNPAIEGVGELVACDADSISTRVRVTPVRNTIEIVN